MPKSSAVAAIAPAITAHSRTCAAISGSTTRTSAAAMANAPRMEPITEADRPRSWPSTGSTKVCTSQQEDRNQLTSSSLRNMGSRTRSQALPPRCLPDAATGGRSCADFTQNQDSNGSAAISRKAERKPAWSITRPALNGPRKFEMAGPIASQENTCLSCVGFSAARPDMALQRDGRRTGSASGQQRAQAKHRKHRKGDGQARTRRWPPPRSSPWDA